MAIENGKVVIPVFHESATKGMLEMLQNRGVDVSKCYLCGAKIEETERPPYNFREKFQGLFGKKKFYEWNINGITAEGVICDKGGCFMKALHAQRDEMIAG